MVENQETRTFKIYPNIEMKPVRFKNRFGIELASHLYLPEGYTEQKNAAIIVAGSFGAVKEQAAAAAKAAEIVLTADEVSELEALGDAANINTLREWEKEM